MRLAIYRWDVLRAAAVSAIALSAGACSIMPSVPEWVDPTTWFGSDNPPDNGQTPDLASLPSKPAATTPDDQQKVAEQLAQDRTHAQYSADALRGGTEAAAAPPPDVAPPPPAESLAAATSAPGRKPAAAAAPAPAQPVRTAQVDRSIAQQPSGTAAPGTLPATPPGAQVAAIEPPPAQPEAQPAQPEAQPAPAETAATPAPEAAPAAPPKPARHHAPAPVRTASLPRHRPAHVAAAPDATPTPAVTQMTAISPSDAALGFKPSSAPPLDPTVSQFVAAPIVDYYQRTASAAGIGYAPAPAPVRVASASSKPHRPRSVKAMGGPEQMTGAVVANLEAIPSAADAPAAAETPSVYANALGLPPAAVVFFPGDTVRLGAEARAQVRAAVDQYKAAGGNGHIRIVGHSSSRTANMSVAQHMAIVFRKSQDRANAVAQEIIREGVPADKVLVDAVGDSQPVYYESMPKGEDGNRRAEIFFQS